MAVLMVRHLEIALLEELTEGAAFLRKEDEYFPLITSEMAETLSEIDDESQREAALEALFKPCSFGGGTVDYSGVDLESDEPQEIPPDVISQLEEIQEPLVDISMEVNGNPIRLIAVFEVQPLVIKVESNEGYFPMVVGLAIQNDSEEPADDWMDQPWASLAKWDSEDRDLLWNILDEYIEACLKEVDLLSEPQVEEAILTVNATIRIAGSKQKIDLKLREILAGLPELGEIAHLEIKRSAPASFENTLKNQTWRSMFDAVEEAEDSHGKGKALEALMVELFGSVRGFNVIQNARTQTEEIDLWIENAYEEAAFFHEGQMILVECKNWAKKGGKNELVILKEKMKNRSGRCKLAFFVSWNGVAGTFLKEQLRSSTEDLLIVPLDKGLIEHAVTHGNFLKVLLEARRKALSV